MNKFYKINLNGVEAYVASRYDASGNDIEQTYATKSLVDSINTSIETILDAIDDIEPRIVNVEGYKLDIDSNTSDINAIDSYIDEVKSTISKFNTDLVNTSNNVSLNSTSINTLATDIDSLESALSSLATEINTLKAIVYDENSGVNALNTYQEQDRANIAKNSDSINVNKQSIISLTSRILALESLIIVPDDAPDLNVQPND